MYPLDVLIAVAITAFLVGAVVAMCVVEYVDRKTERSGKSSDPIKPRLF